MNIKLSSKYKSLLMFIAFVGPMLVFFTIFFLAPILSSFFYSFFSWDGIRADKDFIGLGNYQRMFSDKRVLGSIIVTFKFALVFIILVNIIAFLLALLMDTNIKGRNIYRSFIFMPNAISLIIVAFIWQFLFSHVYGGIVTSLGWDKINISWFGSGKTALATTIITFIWQNVGYYMVIYIAGLQMVSTDYYEAANIDGAGPMSKFFRITLPLMMPSITVNLFLSTAVAFKMFELFFQMTGGGPGRSTEVLSLNIFNEAFNANQVGYASAKAVFLFLIVLTITIIQVRFTKKKEVEL